MVGVCFADINGTPEHGSLWSVGTGVMTMNSCVVAQWDTLEFVTGTSAMALIDHAKLRLQRAVLR